MNTKLSRFVFLAGIYNFLLGLGLFSPVVLDLLGLNVTDPALGYIIGVLLFYTAIVQIRAAQNLNHFFVFVFWEGILRWLAAAVLIPFGFYGHLGRMAGVLGLVDLAIGFVFVVYMPRALGFKIRQLVLNQSSAQN